MKEEKGMEGEKKGGKGKGEEGREGEERERGPRAFPQLQICHYTTAAESILAWNRRTADRTYKVKLNVPASANCGGIKM